jgi:hypothetical protein
MKKWILIVFAFVGYIRVSTGQTLCYSCDLFDQFTREYKRLGADALRPDYTQPGGGEVFKTYILLKAQCDECRNRSSQVQLENGVYSATVKYYNSSTGTHSTYTLDVEVESNRVVAIDFGNGASVHTGFNNSGYNYSGGDLKVEIVNNKPVSAMTDVNIAKGYSEISYVIIIGKDN